MYIFEYERLNEMCQAYALAKGGRYLHLFSSPEPITGICEMNDTVYCSVGTGIYSYSPQNKKLTPLFALAKENNIISLTSDQTSGILYFSTPKAIYALKGNSLIKITDEFPGSSVKYYGNGLIIFSAFSRDLLRIMNVESPIGF